MKAFAVFLSFYIVLLSGLPCVDIVKHDSSGKVVLCQNTGNDHQQDVDQCSPFCTCQCCQANFYVSDSPALFSYALFGISYCAIDPDFKSYELFEVLIPPKS